MPRTTGKITAAGALAVLVAPFRTTAVPSGPACKHDG